MTEAPSEKQHRKRTNFNKMNRIDFIEYLNKNAITYIENNNNGFTEIIPNHYRLKTRRFPIEQEKNSEGIERIIKIITNRIEHMSTKGVYHPKRIKPKWSALETTEDKLNYFLKMVSKKDSSIGFIKLVSVNLCHKTLEAIIIENPSFVEFLGDNKLHQTCIDKFSKYENGKIYLLNKEIII